MADEEARSICNLIAKIEKENQAAVKVVLRPFISEPPANKLTPAGSSQHGESIGSLIGSKAAKIRYYGGPQSSDFWIATGVVQFKKGHNYVTLASEKKSHYITEQYTEQYSRRKMCRKPNYSG